MFEIDSKPKNKFKFLENFGEYIVKISRVIFTVSVIAFFIYFWLENFKTGLISNYFDLNLWLVLAIISGLVVLLFDEPQKPSFWSHFRHKKAVFSLSQTIGLVILSLIVVVVSYIQLTSLPTLRLLLATAIGLSLFLIIYKLKQEKHD